MRIVSHNAFWFQGAPFAPDRPGPAVAGVLARLVEIYRDLSPDLLCLQEVQGEETFEQVAGALGMRGAYCPGAGLPQYGGAVLWKAGGLVADSRALAGRVQRMWQIAELPLPDGSALRVANVHLPSGRQLDPQTAARARRDEVAALLDGPEPPEVILGDFNEQPAGPLGDVLSARGYSDAAELAGRSELGTSGHGRRLDQIWVAQTVQDRLLDYGVVPEEVMRLATPGKTLLSDHFPLWVELAVGRLDAVPT